MFVQFDINALLFSRDLNLGLSFFVAKLSAISKCTTVVAATDKFVPYKNFNFFDFLGAGKSVLARNQKIGLGKINNAKLFRKL